MIAEHQLIGETAESPVRNMNLRALADVIFGATVLGLLLMWLVFGIVGGRLP